MRSRMHPWGPGVRIVLLTCWIGATATRGRADDPVQLLREFIRTPTPNPPGNESALTAPLAERFRQAGMAVELTGPEPARQSLIVRIGGTITAKPWLVLAHVDTVAANPTEWSVDPYAAAITEGLVWGRGALDDKGMAAALAAALLRLHRAPQRPQVPIVAIFAADEEAGSKQGIEWILATRPELFDVQGVLNEGGFTYLDPSGPAPKTYYVSVGEKGVAWIRIRVHGTPGHGSIKWGDNANEKLAALLLKVTQWKHAASTQHPAAQFAMIDLRGKGLRPRSTTEALAMHPLGRKFKSDPAFRSTLSNTCNVTVLKAGEKPNVIPGAAEAVLDCRLVPGETPVRFLDKLRQLGAGFDAEFSLIFESEPNVSAWQTRFFAALQRAARAIDPQSLVVPVLASGATDSRFWRLRDIPAYGIVPIPIEPAMVRGMHGVDERVPIASVEEATRFLELLLAELSGVPTRQP